MPPQRLIDSSKNRELELWAIASSQRIPSQTLFDESEKFKGLFELHHFPGRSEREQAGFILEDRNLSVKSIKEEIGKLTGTSPEDIKISFYTRLLKDSDELVER